MRPATRATVETTLAILATLAACGPSVSSESDAGSGTETTTSSSASIGSASNSGTASTSASTVGVSTSVESSVGDDTSSCTPEPSIGECSLACQDCPDGEKCTLEPSTDRSWPWEWDHSACAPLPDEPLPLGALCSLERDDPCAPGAICNGAFLDSTFLDAPGECVAGCGLCQTICTSGSADLPCEDPATRCVPIAEIGGEDFGVCMTPCNPFQLEPEPCGDGYLCSPWSLSCELDQDPSCYPLDDLATMACRLYPQIEDVHGTPCWGVCGDLHPMCAPAALVAGCEGSPGCCTELCDLAAPDPDSACVAYDAGERCLPLFADGAAPPGVIDVGFCRLP